jgi:hypothetical protein
MLYKYRPDDALTVSELKKRLNGVSLKGNQDPSDMFEELAAIEHVYLQTKSTLGSQNLIGALFATAPEKYHSGLNISAEIKGSKLDIDDLKNAMYKFWCQVGGKPRGDDDKNEIIVSAFTVTCPLCKNQSHKADDCPNTRKDGSEGGYSVGGGHGNQGRDKFM